MSFGSNKAVSLKSVLSELISSQGWEDKLMEVEMPEIWNNVVGKKIAASTKVVKFRNGELWIQSQSSTWRSEIKIRTESIIDKLNENIGKPAVKKLIVR